MKIQRFGTERVGLTISGNVKNREPEIVSIEFPGGCVDVTRARDGEDADYWVHLRVFNARHPNRFDGDGEETSHVSDGRIDLFSKHASDCDAGDLNHPDLYHLAVRVTRDSVAAKREEQPISAS